MYEPILTPAPHIVYYLELFQNTTDPTTDIEPYKRLGPFERPIALTDFGTFENGVNDDDIGLFVEDNADISYKTQPDAEEVVSISMVRIVAEVT